MTGTWDQDPPNLGDRDGIQVDPLGEPEPVPYDVGGDDQVDPLAPASDRQAALADRFVPLVQAPFGVAGIALSRGHERTTRDAITETWRVSEDEARPVADALARALPESWITERLAMASPWIAVAVTLNAMVSARLSDTRRIISHEVQPHAPAPGPAAPVAPSGPDPRPDDGPGGTDPGRGQGVVNPDGWEGAGTGPW